MTSPSPRGALAESGPAGLEPEIDRLRALMRRLAETARSQSDFKSLAELVRCYALASLAFTSLLRTQKMMAGPPDAELEALREESAGLVAARRAARLAGDRAGLIRGGVNSG